MDATRGRQKKECLMLMQTGLGGNDDYYLYVGWVGPQGADEHGGARGYVVPLGELASKYQAADPRFTHNIAGNVNASSGTETINGYTYYIPRVINASGSIAYMTKFRLSSGKDRADLGVPHWGSLIDFPILRYADVVLLYAEAKYQNGDEPEARVLLDSIRARASGDNPSVAAMLKTSYQKANFIEELMDERSRELCGEGWRRLDLIRMGLMESVIRNLKTPTSSDYLSTLGKYYYWNVSYAKTVVDNFSPNKIWFPIPQGERNVNPNLIQNPGYGKEE
jgi:hypothetical protein